jgi:deoxyxylulose-5-phosphate synthase
MVPEAMRAAWILKSEYGYETRILNLHTLKPIDEGAIVRAAHETGIIVTAEEHQIGALAWRVSSVITESAWLYGVPVLTGAVGVKDRFGDSGAPWELIKAFEVSAEHIAQKAGNRQAAPSREGRYSPTRRQPHYVRGELCATFAKADDSARRIRLEKRLQRQAK